MTEVYLDDTRLDFEDRGRSSTIGELIDAVEKDLTSHRRFVMELWVDGERLSGWRGSEVMKKPLSVHRGFVLKTASMEEVALEGLDLAQEYLRVTGDNIRLCISDLRTGNTRADASFSSVFDGLVEVVRTIDALVKGGEKYNMDLFNVNPASYFGPIVNFLEDMKEARESGDHVALADLMEYELSPFVGEMEEKLFHFNA
ncbi:MAG: hypothetical protein HS130_06030 [Deltaproteobacteria bacterium]|nr:hypothetical protein [Deltaproteobacteria bacterium]MCL4872507.1 hypothetical protein [bacterium]